MHEPITEQPPTPALIEAPLRETHSRYSALFGFLQEAVFVADAETGMILDANPAAEELTGRSLSEIRTFHHSQLHPPEDAERARLAFASVLGQPTLSQGGDRLGEWDLRHAGGRKIPVDIFVTPWKGDDGTSLVLGVFRDLREQRHVSESLRRSEERFRQIAEVTGEFIWEVNSEGLYTYASAASEQIFGYKPEEIVGIKHFYDFFVPARREDMTRAAFQVFDRRESLRSFPNLNLRRDGRMVALETTAVPMFGADGVFLGYRGTDRDVTERQSAEALLRAVMDSSPDPIFVKDSASRFLLANNATLAALGKAKEEALGKTDVAIYPDSSMGLRLMANDRQVMETGETQFFEELVPTPSGSRTYLTAKLPYRDAQGATIGVIGIARDITDRKAAEQALSDSEARFRATFMNGVDAVCLATFTGGRIVDINQAFANLFGYSRDEVVGRTALDLALYCDSEDRTNFVAALESRGSVEDFQTIARKKGGEQFLASITAETFRLGGEWHVAGTIRDITKPKRIDQALRESESKYRRLHESITDAVVTVDIAGRILEFNPVYRSMLGYSGEELCRLTYQEITPERWHDMEARIISEQVLPLGHSEVYEKEYRRRDGSVFPVELRTYLLKDDSGRPAGMWAIVRDITDRKQAEQLLRGSEKRFRSLFEGSLDAVFLTHVSGRIDAANPAACALFGMSEEEICRLGRDGLVRHDERLRASLEERRLTGRMRAELTYTRKNGSRFDGEVESVQLGDDGCAFVIVRDVTERKRAAEALRLSEKKFATLFRCSPVSITLSDLNDGDRFLEVNQAFEEFTGHQRDSVIGRTYPPDWLWADPLEYASAISQFSRDGRLSDFEFRFRRSDGEIRSGILYAELVEFDGKSCVLATTIDITERKRVEEERERLQHQLAHAQKMESVGRLAGGVAHDFNNLMGVVLMHADSALDEIGSGEAPVESVGAIRDAAEKAVALGRQLMAFSSKQVPQPEVLSLNSAIAESQKLVRRLIGEDIRVVFRPADGLGLVKADRGQIGQIIMNLAVNSRDAMPQGGSFTIETANIDFEEGDARLGPDAQPGAYVSITVRDTGTGMDQTTLARIFEPFFSTKGAVKGTGLGLSVVYGIVKQSSGFIAVESEPGRGTEFRIYLPAVLEPPTAVSESDEGAAEGGSETVLLVEDEPALRKKLLEVLEHAGYRVTAAGDGMEALEITSRRAHPLDLLLTDVVMPGLSGARLSEQFRVCHPAARILYMSGYPDDGDGSLHLQSKPNFLQKPFTREKLLRKVREVLNTPLY